MPAITLFTQSRTAESDTAATAQQNPDQTQLYRSTQRPLVILHGLFGNWENWGTRIRHYRKFSAVHAMDLRNHGESQHLESMDYSEMADDVIKTLDDLGVADCDLLGHSMGGKVAMRIASLHPDRVARLIVVDIAPKDYPPHHQSIIDALCSIKIAELKSRKDADLQLSEAVADSSVRAFLLKNLVRPAADAAADQSTPETGFRWQFNLPGIRDSYPQLMSAPQLDEPYDGPVLFVKGAESAYLQDADRELVLRSFPNSKLKVIGGAGHWPHAEKPEIFDRILGQFLGFPTHLS